MERLINGVPIEQIDAVRSVISSVAGHMKSLSNRQTAKVIRVYQKFLYRKTDNVVVAIQRTSQPRYFTVDGDKIDPHTDYMRLILYIKDQPQRALEFISCILWADGIQQRNQALYKKYSKHTSAMVEGLFIKHQRTPINDLNDNTDD